MQVRTAGADAADEVALRLLRDLGCRDLQVTTGSLEDAFVALTTPECSPESSPESSPEMQETP